MFLDIHGYVHAFGLNESGQLVLGDLENRKSPTNISDLPKIISTALVAYESKIYTTGLKDSGQLKLGDTTSRFYPTEIPGLRARA